MKVYKAIEGTETYEQYGEVKYHDYFSYENDILIAEIGHYESEQYTKDLLYSIIREKFPTLDAQLTRVNTNPIKYL
jgi:putative NIF3 family GTP cyclohydrolase 1 type 2